jgi:NIMA (never in mitosis gene a)-related kinase
MNEKDRDNAINEVRILASIQHPNIVSYREAFVDKKEQTLCIVMTYADNGDLLQMIKERSLMQLYFKEKQVWRVLIESVHGLQSMHDMSVMHRDIKCANVFLFKVKDIED